MKVSFGSTSGLMQGLKSAGLDLLATKTEAGPASGELVVARQRDCAIFTFQANRPMHFLGPKKASLLAVVGGKVWNYGEETQPHQMAGFNPNAEMTDCFVPAGVKLSAVVLHKQAISTAVRDQGDQQAVDVLHTGRAVTMTKVQKQRFSTLIKQGLQSELIAEDALLEFQAIAGQGNCSDLGTDSLLHRAVEAMAARVNDPLFSGAELARCVHANERWLRKSFQNYGVSPMSFRRFMRLAAVDRFIGTDEGKDSTPQQIANLFGYASHGHMLRLYRAHFGRSFLDAHRQQMMLF